MYGGTNNLKTVASSYNRNELEEAVQAEAAKKGLEYFDARKSELLPDVLSLVSEEEARKGVVPLQKKENLLLLGLANPESEDAKTAISYFSKHFKVAPALISWESVKDALPHYKGLVKQKLDKDEDYEIEATEEILTFADFSEHLKSAPLQEILNHIVTLAIESDASDIHLEPQRLGARIRFRIDGVLHIVGQLDAERFKYVLSQIELTSGLKLNINESQEGRMEVKLKDKEISIRVETMPTLHGDDISLRIFNTEATMLSIKDLGLAEYSKPVLTESLSRPHGMILVVGPTGAGKTSTIYAILNTLNRPEVKIVTLEDPIEYALPGITQSQIHEDESFLKRLKAVLREDPDIVMVGEIRDGETADVALHAALTGHVMISTFHANNAVTAIGLLKELSKNKSLLGTSINLIIAQRLVRKICEKCKKPHTLGAGETEFTKRIMKEMPEEIKVNEPTFFEPVGCDACGKIGYKGRVGIFELLPMNIELQKLIGDDKITISELQDSAKKSGMVTMEQDGFLKAASGLTSISEVMKAVKE